MTPQTILIVDDDQGVRNSLSAILRTYGHDPLVCASGSEALALLETLRPDSIVLDVRMPGMDGLTFQKLLREKGVDIPVIVVTGFGDIPLAVAAMKAGAADFIEKPIDDRKLIAALDAARHRHISSVDRSEEAMELRQRYAALTPREQRIANLVADGYSTAAIASHLSISSRTVDHHRANILAKMQATSLPQLLKFLLTVQNPRPPN